MIKTPARFLAAALLVGVRWNVHVPVQAAENDPLPVPFQVQIQVQAEAKPAQPNPAGNPAAPVPRGNNFSMKTSTRNGVREIEVKDNELEVGIKDQLGKNIEMKITKPVDGKPKTDEFKATDLDDLRKKSADAAKLYEKYGVQNGGLNPMPIFGGGGIAGGIQVVQQANGRNIIVNQANGFSGTVQNGNVFPRTIRSEVGDRKVTIEENEKREITITTTEIVDGQPKTGEVKARNLTELLEKDVELAKLYIKLTGIGQ